MQQPNILIVKLSAIGDVVHTLPALNALRRQFRGAHISWLVEEAAAGLIKGHCALDEILVARRKTWLQALRRPARRRAALGEITGFLRHLRQKPYDLVFDFQASLKGAVWIAWVRGKRKIGFGRGLEHQEHSYWVLNERIPAVSMEIHALERSLLLLQAAGVQTGGAIEYQLPISAGHRQQAAMLMAQYQIDAQAPFVAINPMAKWETKLWDQQKFGRVADHIQTVFGLPVVFTGGSEDRAYIDDVMAHMRTKGANLAGRTDLLTLAALLQRALLMITTDTGPMHMAAAVGTPTVALFGPTAPWRTGPYGKGHRIVRSVRPCCPCFKRHCAEQCACMADISVEQVLKAACDLLQAHADPRYAEQQQEQDGC